MNEEERRFAKFKRRYRFGDAPRVFIYCDDIRHAQRIRVAEFEYQADLVPPLWHPTLGGESQERMVGDTPFAEVPVWTPASGTPPPDEIEPSRFRYRLRCRKCRYEVQATEDKLEAALDRLRLAGVSQLSLRGLARVI